MTPSLGQETGAIVRKIPAVTAAFWVMKICATTLGETAGDLLSMTLDVGYAISTLILLGFFLATLVIIAASRWFGYSFPFFFAKLWDDPMGNLELLWAPSLILGIGLSGTIMRLTRAQMLGNMARVLDWVA